MTEGALKHAEAREIVARIEERRVVVLPDALFGQLSSVVHGVGMLLLVEKIDAGLSARVAETCVILGGIQDAGNVGSILRSAAAAGIARVFCAPGTDTRGRRRCCAPAWARTSCWTSSRTWSLPI